MCLTVLTNDCILRENVVLDNCKDRSLANYQIDALRRKILISYGLLKNIYTFKKEICFAGSILRNIIILL